MYRTIKVPFSCSSDVRSRLHEMNILCAEVWNACLVHAKTHHLQTGKWINKSQLQKATKGQFRLYSQSIQAVVHKYLFARDSAYKARQKGYKIKYPYKQKRFFNTKWAATGFSLESDGTLMLSQGIYDKKLQPQLKVKLPIVPYGTVKEVELVYDRGYYFSLSYEDGVNVDEKVTGHTVAIDPGEIHTISAVSTDGNSLVLSGRKLRSIHRLRNKNIGQLQRLMSKCKKGSRQWKKYNHAKQYILQKSERQLQDGLHKTTKAFINWCIERDTKDVVIGDVEGVQRGTSNKNKKNKKKKIRNRKTNQKLSNWSFGKLNWQLEYKLASHGISLDKVDESFTSQTCPVCGQRKKTSKRIYKCRCGYKQHRDVHGGSNILSRRLYGRFVVMPLTYITYLRPA